MNLPPAAGSPPTPPAGLLRDASGAWRAPVFFASGFAGLIYESIWTHYLKLFLGHAAYAQTLVLAIFMGGMALGAAAAARHTGRIARPLAVYAGIEACVGLLALVFHFVFTLSTEGLYALAQQRPLDGSTFAVLKWGLATLLILPQSVLLGATFPVFAAAATRADPVGAGRQLATLYFANSLGGALGVLASGFVLVPRIGLPATMAAAGAMNLAIAATVWRLGRSPIVATAPSTAAGGTARPGRMEALMLVVALLTGASSFIYEVGWIRMLSLVLGSATHSFELMLSAFILGLALGGLWVRRHIDGAASPGRLLGWVQVAMGLAALATVPLHSASFDLMAYAMRELPRTDGGYALYNALRYGVSAAIMLPATFCAGMTLPLATAILLRRTAGGERAIGWVYAANTLGAISGLMFAVHLGLPLLGLEYLVASGALLDVALGVVLLAVFGGRRRLALALLALVGGAVATVAAAASFNPRKLASGVFRTGTATLQGEVIQIAHGKTATIAVEQTTEEQGRRLSLRTNGKPDASAMIAGSTHTLDEVTMALIAVVPALMHPAPRRVANIGFGSGITSSFVLADPQVQRLDTVEIEVQVPNLARHFTGHNEAAYTDPRSLLHIDDAKSYFAASGQRWDLILSEPSNPWVSGVAGLFSVEFYRRVAPYLNSGGLFAQWLQIYEMHPQRAASVLKAVDAVFADWMVVALNHSDLLIIARADGPVSLPADAWARLSDESRMRLRRLSVGVPADLTLRVVGNRAMLKPWLDAQPAPANSDFAPYLDAHADRDRFMRASWHEVVGLAATAYPMAELLGARAPLPSPTAATIHPQLGIDPPPLAARQVRERLLGPSEDPRAFELPRNLPPHLARLGDDALAVCAQLPAGADAGFGAARLAVAVLPYISADEGRRVLDALRDQPCMRPGPTNAWPALLYQVAARDGDAFAATAEAMLDAGQGGTEVRDRYLLGLAVLGHVARGDPARARAVWQRHAAKALRGNPPGLALEVLQALSQQGVVTR